MSTETATDAGSFFRKIQQRFLDKRELSGRITLGGIWLSFGGGIENGLRLVRNMILARILAPEVFGLMAIIVAVNALMESFTQLGIKESVIQHPRGAEERYLNGAFWISFGRGIIIFIIASLVAPLITGFYGAPQLTILMRVALVSVVLNGAMSPKSYVSLKDMKYDKWVLIFHGGGFIGILVTIIISLMYPNIWALVIGYIAESASRLIMSYIITPFRPRFEFEKESLTALFTFARNIFGLPILAFMYDRISIFVLAKFVTAAELGMYSLAYTLVNVPYMICGTIFAPILLPVFATMQHDGRRFVKGVLVSSKLMAGLFLPFMTILAFGASWLLTIVYGKAYAAVSLTFSVFCISIALRIVGTVIVNAFYAIGQPQMTREASLVRVITLMVIIIPLVMGFGVLGAAYASLVSSFVWLVVQLLRLKGNVGITVQEYMKSLSYGVLGSIVIGSLYYVLIL